MLPLLWMLSASLMPTGESTALPPRLLPSAVTLEHYAGMTEAEQDEVVSEIEALAKKFGR